jgi:glycosyltransferase involved in cell wall biosynthesis
VTSVEPELSLILPCYNEEHCLPETVPPLAAAFITAGVTLELVLVDNGSTDATGRVINDLIASGLPIRKVTVPINRGQGLGIRSGLEQGQGRILGYICADGQIAPADVVQVFLAARAATQPTLTKALRANRDDGWQRQFTSQGFNHLMRFLFPSIQSRDVNGNPKFLPRNIVRQMQLVSDDWFLEAEIVLKATYLGLPVHEIAVPGLPRNSGTSHVRWSAVAEFFGNIVRYRLGGAWRDWKRTQTRQR